MPSAQLSPLQPDPSEHALETWVFVKPVASPAVCTSKVTDDMFIRYTIKLLQLVTFISHKLPLSIFAIFNPRTWVLQLHRGTPQVAGQVLTSRSLWSMARIAFACRPFGFSPRSICWRICAHRVAAAARR